MEPTVMTTTDSTVDSLAELCFALACDEVDDILDGPQHIGLEDLTACEVVALLTIIGPAFERRAAAQGQPGWIRDRTYELHQTDVSYDAARRQAEAEADDKFGAEEGPI
jgi:hypothetical protein